MKLFIRTQDRTALEEVNEVHIDVEKAPHRKTKYHIVAQYHPVGTYATRHRCIEIIDEIEKRLSEDVDFVLYAMPEK